MNRRETSGEFRPTTSAQSMIITALVLANIAACRPGSEPDPPPLRPLLHTQAPAGVDRAIEGYEEWLDPNVDPTAWPTEFQTTSVSPNDVAVSGPAMTPEALILDVYAALTTGDADRLELHLFDVEGLAEASQMNRDTATRTAEEIRSAAFETFAVFTSGSPSDERAGGLGGQLQTGQLVVGRGRNVDGSAVQGEQVPIMHWGSELTFMLRGTETQFVLRFPNLLRDDRGIWRLRAAPTVDQKFRTYRALGLDLKPELMDVEHAAIPLGVGNYWHYRTRRPSAVNDDEYGVLTRDGFRDAVTEVLDYGGYRVVRFRRMFDDPSRQSERFAYLITPRRLFVCDRECQRRASDFEWMLTYAARRTPVLVFPLELGEGWSVGGEPGRANEYRVDPELQAVTAPAGNFIDAFEIARSTPRGRQSSFFVPGIGFVLQRTTSTVETTLEELVAYRILP